MIGLEEGAAALTVFAVMNPNPRRQTLQQEVSSERYYLDS